MGEGAYTHITWPEGTEIKEDFLRACAPMHYSQTERHMVVHRPMAEVEETAKRLNQKGLVMAPGQYR